MVVGKFSKNSNETVTLLPKHVGWKTSAKFPTFFPKTHFRKKNSLSLAKLVKSSMQPTFFPKTHFRFVVGKIGENSNAANFLPETHFGL